MIFEYCEKAIEKAEYRKLEDGNWLAEIPGFQGVWENGSTVEECRKELITVLEEWLILKLRELDPVPDISPVEGPVVDAEHGRSEWSLPWAKPKGSGPYGKDREIN